MAAAKVKLEEDIEARKLAKLEAEQVPKHVIQHYEQLSLYVCWRNPLLLVISSRRQRKRQSGWLVVSQSTNRSP